MNKTDEKIRKIKIDLESLEKAESDAMNDWWYGTNQDILVCLVKKFPFNKDEREILMKVKYLDTFYSTNLRMLGGDYVKKIAEKILSINHFDERLKNNENDLVLELMKVKNEREEVKELFSFATKYCALHNPSHYFIFDSVNGRFLRKIFEMHYELEMKMNGKSSRCFELKNCYEKIDTWIKEKNYSEYNNSIDILLGDLKHKCVNAKRKLDWLIWYNLKDVKEKSSK